MLCVLSLVSRCVRLPGFTCSCRCCNDLPTVLMVLTCNDSWLYQQAAADQLITVATLLGQHQVLQLRAHKGNSNASLQSTILQQQHTPGWL